MSHLPLAAALTARVKTATLGLESGSAEMLDAVTPTTAELLRHWFAQDITSPRPFNFHAGQKQAILNVIYAHEVLGQNQSGGVATLKELYDEVAPDSLLSSHERMLRVSKDAHPKYCLKMATGTGKTWVLQALMAWQYLNWRESPDDPRFTRNFLLVAPGNIVYERLLDALMGKVRGGVRDFDTSDIARYAELFTPEDLREPFHAFVRTSACGREEIGTKATGGGLVAITNWQRIKEQEEDDLPPEDAPLAPGADIDHAQMVADLLPLAPGTSTGNALETLDARYRRGGRILDFLAKLPDLMVFNDEAHHVHEVKAQGETIEVEWQKSMNALAESKGRKFTQVDFSATPYNDLGSGKTKRKDYFPHIVADFELKTAMQAGLVKSLVLDKRKELAALPLEFKAERDADNNPVLADGQRVMLRAGLAKLKKLEADFATVDETRRPKMLVMCEDTTVTPLVEDFLKNEGLGQDEVLRVDSNKKGDISEKDWAILRERLFDVDKHANPRVIVSVLMLREGFDVSNICVIVPLRSSAASILLEQTIGRGLRLMWRDPEYDDLKKDTRKRLKNGQHPDNLLDVLCIIEHPRFEEFYEDLKAEGLVGETDEDDDATTSTGDVESIGLVAGYEAFDFAVPQILSDAEEALKPLTLEIETMAPFTAYSREWLAQKVGSGDEFISQDFLNSTLFGAYRVNGAVMNVAGYNDYLARMSRRIGQALAGPLPKRGKVSDHVTHPYLQSQMPAICEAVDAFVRTRLFDGPFDPMEKENWRMLLVDVVAEHITKVFASRMQREEETVSVAGAEVRHRRLSELCKWPMRRSSSVAVNKCVYARLPYPSQSGGLEQSFMEWASRDASVEAFCKIAQNKHDFLRIRYLKEDGNPAWYWPDFVVRTQADIWLVETKAQDQTNHPNVVRKRNSALHWCARINELAPDQRGGRKWRYALVGEQAFGIFQERHGTLADLLESCGVFAVQGKAAALFGNG